MGIWSLLGKINKQRNILFEDNFPSKLLHKGIDNANIEYLPPIKNKRDPTNLQFLSLVIAGLRI